MGSYKDTVISIIQSEIDESYRMYNTWYNNQNHSKPERRERQILIREAEIMVLVRVLEKIKTLEE